MLHAVIAAAAAYLIGSIPFPVIVSRWVGGVDLREHGSGNMGAMNAAAVLGRRWFPLVFGLDLAKGAGAAYLAMSVLPGGMGVRPLTAAALGGFLAALGHCFPVLAGFRGGLGLAASAGALLVASPVLIALVGAAILLFWGLSRNLYLGVAGGAAAAPLLGWWVLPEEEALLPLAAWALLIAAVNWRRARSLRKERRT